MCSRYLLLVVSIEIQESPLHHIYDGIHTSVDRYRGIHSLMYIGDLDAWVSIRLRHTYRLLANGFTDSLCNRRMTKLHGKKDFRREKRKSTRGPEILIGIHGLRGVDSQCLINLLRTFNTKNPLKPIPYTYTNTTPIIDIPNKVTVSEHPAILSAISLYFSRP